MVPKMSPTQKSLKSTGKTERVVIRRLKPPHKKVVWKPWKRLKKGIISGRTA